MKDEKVPVVLDRQRYIIFDMNAFYEMEKQFGSFDDMIVVLTNNPKESIPLLLWIGLLHDDEHLTIDQVKDMIADTAHIQIAEKILQAVSLGLPESDKTKTNGTKPEKQENAWDWAWFNYMGTVLLNRPEAVFWRTTPRKIFALWEIHKKVNGLDKEEQESPEQAKARALIDQYI